MNNRKLIFKDVIGCDYAKDILNKRLRLFYENKERHKKMNIKIDLGIILFGFPGVGKSELAKSCPGEFSSNKDLYFDEIDGSYFMGGIVGSSTKKIKNWLDNRMKIDLDTVMIIDECETLFKNTNKTNSVLTQERTNAFKRILDINVIGSKIFVIGTTNRPYDIDPAFHRRFKFVYIPMPNEQERVLHLKRAFLDIVDGDDLKLQILSKHTEDYTGDDFNELRTELFYKYPLNNGSKLDLNNSKVQIDLIDDILKCKSRKTSLNKGIKDFKNKYDKPDSIWDDAGIVVK